MEHSELKELLPLRGLDALDIRERRELERHIEDCPECRLEGTDYAKTAALLAQGAVAVMPPARLKARVLAATTGVASKSPASRTSRTVRWPLLVAAGLLAIFMPGIFLLVREISGLRGISEENRARIQALESDLAARNRFLFAQQAPGVRLASLQGTAGGAGGSVVLNPATGQAALFIANMRPPGQERDYQLWILGGPAPVPAGLLNLDAEGFCIYTFKIPADTPPVSGFAVSVEPRGGRPAPTGPIILTAGF